MKVGEKRKSRVVTFEELHEAYTTMEKKKSEYEVTKQELWSLEDRYNILLKRSSAKVIKQHHLKIFSKL